MSTVLVACPRCGKELKLRDRSKLGQKAKCPGCDKPFVLQESAADEVQIELVENAVPVGTGAQWVPDDPPAGGEAPGFTLSPAGPVKSPAGSVPLGGLGSSDGGIQRLKEIRRRNAKRRNMAILFGGVTAVAIAGAAWGLSTQWKADPAVDPAAVAGSAAGTPVVAEPGATPTAQQAPASSGTTLATVIAGPSEGNVIIPFQDVTSQHQRKENAQLVEALWPRRGKPVQLYMIPSGMNVVFHLRPALLWSDAEPWQELRYSLTEDVTNWLAAELKKHCRREPQEIEECLIAVRLGAIGTDPQVAAVVHFAKEQKLSDLIEEFRGQRLDGDSAARVHISPPYAYLIRDTKTVAIAPEQDAAEFPDVITAANTNTTEGLYQLLNLTDQARVFTVVFEVDDVKRHEEWLFSARTRPVFQRVLNWFGDDVETVSWSLDVHEESVASELVLRPRSISNSSRVAAEMLKKLEFLPHELQSACVRMRPETRGYLALIGRFPAMLEAYRQATVPTVETRHVRLTTVLPRKAAPNLALGSLLTWDQSTKTDFSAAAPPPTVASAGPRANLPDKVEDRLKLTFEGEFNQPFQDAVAYIASECQVEIDIDGNALKDAGFTKNMPLKLSIGKVSGLEAFKQIILYERYRPPTPDKQLCIVIDEAAKTVLVTTEAFAAAEGKTVYPLVPR